MSEHFFSKVEIKNFKSIEYIEFECKRINVFIGKPNVGKSCIIEALSLLANPDLLFQQDLKSVINFEDNSNLFHNNINRNNISIRTDNSIALMNYDKNYNFLKSNNKLLLEPSNHYLFDDFKSINEIFNQFKQKYGNPDLVLLNPYNSDIHYYQITEHLNDFSGFTKPYKFKANINYLSKDNLSLLIPNGNNLFWILSQYEDLQNEFAEILGEYNLDLVYDPSKNLYFSQKKLQKYNVSQIPFSMLADTIQRIIFYSAAIESNNNSILLFEEPEVNSFPPYIQELSNKILLSKTNQFFITTHSPYLLTTLLESSTNEVILNIVGYKDGKTTIYQTSSDEISELLSYDSDIFLNIDRYI
ncbi:MAG: ATP-binding protein [Candidatus Kapabacteria bacterium]|nr:ATP-binding protein [Ignavibacteriota bacterium]MCW5884759.1 ATP-binding protein [Candidatus Kapabacteria bacterium]